MSQVLVALRREIRAAADPSKAKVLAGFFKTGKGEYGEGDVFLGLTVPVSRSIASRHRSASFADIRNLLRSRFHEERLIGLLILVGRHERGDLKERSRVFQFYLANADRVNNWDLVDLSAPQIIGMHLLETGAGHFLLAKMARSKNLWRRRIGIVSTFSFIRANDFAPTWRVAAMLLGDRQDLIHKACGWMLREAGKRDGAMLRRWLKRHLPKLPRTTLRYAIERFPKKERQRWLAK